MKRREFIKSGFLSLASSRLGISAFDESHIKTSSAECDFYVAPSGKDSNPGTAAAPFATIGHARDAVREQIRAGLTKNIYVRLRGGTYSQTETLTFGTEDSGTEKYSITYAASPGERVVLSGGKKITGWTRGLSAIWTAKVPEVKTGQLYFRQLFINGKRAIRARTPNPSDKTPWGKITTSAATADSPPSEDVPIPIAVTVPIKAYNNPGDVELVYIYNNEEGRKRLAAINEKDQVLALAPPNHWNSRKFLHDWGLSLPSAGKACYLENALEMLDQPGEWYLDRRTGILSYWPRDGEDLTRDDVTAPVLQKTILAVVGTHDHPVVNVHFKGVHAQYVDWPLPLWGYMGLFCCNVETGGDSQPGHRPIEAAVEYEFARSCNFTDGGIAHVGGMGLCLRNGTAYNRIEGNEISDLGAGGISAGYPNSAGGYFYAAPPPDKDEYKGYRIANNYVHHCGTDYYGAVGVLIYPCQDSVVSHNLIHDTAYLGIGVAGSQDPKLPFARNNVVEYNHIYETMKVTVDGAGMYITFDQWDRGCLVRGNLIHDTGGNPYARLDYTRLPSAGLYLDGDGSGAHYENNILYRNPAVGPLIFDYENAKQKNSWLDNLFQKDGAPPQEFIEAAQAHAGLEPAYQQSILKMEPNPCQQFSLINCTAMDGLVASQFDLPQKNRGVVQIIRRSEGTADVAILKFLRLHASSNYEMKAYASSLTPSAVWGPPDASGPVTMAMLSEVVPIRLSDLGLATEKNKTKISGRELMEQGLSMRFGQPPQVVWIAYQRVT